MSELITHKADLVCPMTGPHDVAICGLVAARRRRSTEVSAILERQLRDEHDRAARRHPS